MSGNDAKRALSLPMAMLDRAEAALASVPYPAARAVRSSPTYLTLLEACADDDVLGAFARTAGMAPMEAWVAESWGLCRQSYRVDPALADALADTEPFDVPVAQLRRLPFPVLYLDMPVTLDLGDGPRRHDGLFVDTREPMGLMLHPVLVSGDPAAASVGLQPVPWEWTLDRLGESDVDEASVAAKIAGAPDGALATVTAGDVAGEARGISERYPRNRSELGRVVSLLLYLTAQNADVEAAWEPTRNEARRLRKRGRAVPCAWDVGAREGAKVTAQEALRRAAAGAHGPGVRRSHWRRGHWHHFWVGPKDGERELVLKWVAPCFVGKGQEGAPETGHEVTL